MTNDEALLLALKETVRYGMFLGTFAGASVSVDECIAALWGRKRSALVSHPAVEVILVASPLPIYGKGRRKSSTTMVGDSLI